MLAVTKENQHGSAITDRLRPPCAEFSFGDRCDRAFEATIARTASLGGAVRPLSFGLEAGLLVARTKRRRKVGLGAPQGAMGRACEPWALKGRSLRSLFFGSRRQPKNGHDSRVATKDLSEPQGSPVRGLLSLRGERRQRLSAPRTAEKIMGLEALSFPACLCELRELALAVFVFFRLLLSPRGGGLWPERRRQ